MTDQDPTQRYEAPLPPQPAAMEPPAPEPAAMEPPAPEPAAMEPPAPPSPFEAVVAAPTAPVAVATTAGPGRSRLRWLIAGLVTLLVVGTAAGATFLLTRDAGDPDVLVWAPADSIMYVEARLDLPGDQQAELAEVLSAFPGFDDQAAFPTKLSEALDQLVDEASGGEMSYTADIEPWFGGQVSMSIGELPTATDPSSIRMLVLAGTKDAARASAWAADLLAESGATSTTEDYQGTTITVVTPPEPVIGMGSFKAAYAVVGPVLAVGDLASVKAAIDTGGTSGLPSSARFKEASASVSGDRLGFAYLDYQALLDGFNAMVPDVAAPMPELPSSLTEQLPAWLVETVRAEDGAIVVDVQMPHSELNGTPSVSRLPSLVPPSTVVLIEGHDVGASVAKMQEMYADIEPYRELFDQLDEGLALVGGFDALTGWIGEAGIAVTRDGDTVGGGIVVVPTDPADADRLFTQVKGFLALGGSQAGITVSEEEYGGTTITIVDLGDLGELLGAATGGSLDLPPDTEDVKLAFAVTDEVVVVGYGTDFVKGVLDARTGDSLAKDPRFAAALDRVGATNLGLWWVDVAALRDLIEGALPSEAKATYESDVKPYLDAFDYVISASTAGDTYDGGSVIIHVAGD
ncbi:MAG: hypothetical protein A2V85_05875 [Chloroflexi bacterium RBG_16_72_14]|nr:MAG: hypothetical protein A2V85_05875 [Chloroflexi bacterium RBG_16_72_14]